MFDLCPYCYRLAVDPQVCFRANGRAYRTEKIILGEKRDPGPHVSWAHFANSALKFKNLNEIKIRVE